MSEQGFNSGMENAHYVSPEHASLFLTAIHSEI